MAEIKNLLTNVKRKRVEDLLNIEIRKIETTISELKAAAQTSPDDPTTIAAAAASAQKPTKCYDVELTNYAWDQSEKFVKLYVTLDGVQHIEKDNITVNYTDHSLCLQVNNLNNKNYKLIINHLLEPIDATKSFHKVKTNLIIIYAQKIKEKSTWSHLTSIQKRFQEVNARPERFADLDRDEPEPKDPTSGLFKVMKDLYEKGDPEMKRLITKAWVEGEEKGRSQMTNDF